MKRETALAPEHYLKHAGWMKVLARSLLDDEARAEDLVQEAWLRAVERPRRGPEALGAWLSRVLRNFARQSFRGETRRRRREVLAARPEVLSSPPGELLDRAETHRKVVEAVTGLDEPYRSTILLRFFKELSLKETAERMGVPLSTAKTRLRRALEQLRGRLRGGGPPFKGALVPLLAKEVFSSASSPSIPLWALSAKGVAMKLASISLAALGALALGAASLVLLFASSGQREGFREELALKQPAAPPLASVPGAGVEGEGRAAGAPSLEASFSGSSAAALESRGPPGAPEEPESASPAPMAQVALGEPALRMRKEYFKLKEIFGHGGKDGWGGVKKRVASLRALWDVDGGVEELLRLLDEERDGDFLEALLHHLAMADPGSEGQENVLLDESFQDELWRRFEEEEAPQKRMAYLGFFSYHSRLSGKKMQSFLEIAAGDPSPEVRSKSIDAIVSARDLLPESWPVLCEVAELDENEDCRAMAIRGLARVETERAAALVRAAFRSPSERMKAAAMESPAGADPPAEVTGGDAVAYLRSELRGATTRAYRQALLRRLLQASPLALKEEMESVLKIEKDLRVQAECRAALEEARKALGEGS